MKCFLPLLCLIALIFSPFAAAAKEKKPYVLYAEFVDNTPVELSTGAKWLMEKGDCFPIHMFKERQTKVVLQLGTATFWTDSYRVRVLKESDEPKAIESYRKMLDSFLKTQTEKGKKEGAQ